MPNAVLRSICSISTLRWDYGQNSDFWKLPVKCSSPLRANPRFFDSARKCLASVTGKTSIFEICPESSRALIQLHGHPRNIKKRMICNQCKSSGPLFWGAVFSKRQIFGHFLGFPTDPRRFSRLLQVLQSGILCVPEKRRPFWQYHECWPFDLFPSAIILTGRIKRWNKPRHSCMIFGYSSGSIFRP